MLLLPVLVAKRERTRAESARTTRVATSGAAADLPVRYRIDPDVTSGHIDDDAGDDLVAPAPAARTMHV
jgi:hypothetical protein